VIELSGFHLTFQIQSINQYLHHLTSSLSSTIFETSAHCVERDISEWFDKKFSSFFPSWPCLFPHISIDDADRTARHQQENIVLLHLGVDSSSNCFSIETSCYNDASFRVPDEQGYKPWKQPICSDLPWSLCRRTSLHVSTFIQRYLLECPRHPGDTLLRQDQIRISTDPGRFVCNYTYFYALKKAEEWNHSNFILNNKPTVHVLFIHVPPFYAIPESNQIQFLHQFMDGIKYQLDLDLNKQ
jgi:pyroglutamyl-peptidase